MSGFDERGVYFSDPENRRPPVYVSIIELSWQRKHQAPENYVELGEWKEIVILRRGEDGWENWIGSIRRLDKEGNPYRRFLGVPKGTRFLAIVKDVIPTTVVFDLCEFPDLIVRTRYSIEGMRRGDRVAVTISELDTERGQLIVELAEPDR